MAISLVTESSPALPFPRYTVLLEAEEAEEAEAAEAAAEAFSVAETFDRITTM